MKLCGLQPDYQTALIARFSSICLVTSITMFFDSVIYQFGPLVYIIPPSGLQPAAAGLPDCTISTMRSQHERAVLTAAVLTVLTAQYRLASWTWSRKVPAEQAVIEAEVANGWHLRYNALPSTLAEAERSAFALVPDATYLTPDVPPDEWYHDWHGVVPGGAAWGAGGDVRSPWAVWTTRALLSAEECAAMSILDTLAQELRWIRPACLSISAPDNASGCPYSFAQPRTTNQPLGPRRPRPYL